MGWKCAPQVVGLVRGEPKPGQKHRANIHKIAKEAGYERGTKSETFDRSRSHLNRYEGYTKGADFADDMVREADEYKAKVTVKTKDGGTEVRERKLRADAVIGWGVIYNPPAEVCANWTDEDYAKFYSDCDDCMEIIEPRLFRKSNIRFAAEHFDEGVPPEENLVNKIDRHIHKMGISLDENGNYCGNLIDAKLLVKINKEFPSLMRERGWEMDDLDVTDFEKAKTDLEYKAERDFKRGQSGKSVNQFMRKKAESILDEAEAIAGEMMQIFLQLHISEKSGRGVPKITEVYGKDAFTFRENSIVVTIPFTRIRDQQVGNKVGNDVGNKKPLNARRKKIIAEMRDNPNVTTAELHIMLGISDTAVENNITFLKENGYIERIGAKKNGYWKVL